MPTLLEISNSLIKMFVKTSNKNYAAKRIVTQLNYLQHSDTKQSIDLHTKAVILQVMHELITGQRPIKLPNDEKLLIKSKDVISFPAMQQKILQMLRKKEEENERSHIEIKRAGFSFHTLNLHF